MKKIVSLLLVLLLGVSLVACGGKAEEPVVEEEHGLRILQFVEQALGSLSCEDLINDGIKEFVAATPGATLDVFECNFDTNHVATQLSELCATGKYDVVVIGYWDMQEYIQQAALDFPDIKFIAFDCTIDFAGNPGIENNVVSVMCRQNTLAFAAGALGALISESGAGLANEEKIIGFVGGGHVTAIDDFLVGYIEGAQYVDPEMKVLYSYVGDWENTGKAKELALDQYKNGADVSFGVCAPASFGVCEAAAEAGAYAFGVDTDHSAQLAGTHADQSEATLASAVKQFGWAVRDVLYQINDGTLTWGQTIFNDFDSGYLTMVGGTAFDKVVKEGMPEAYAKYEAIVNDLLAGKIKVDTAIDNPDLTKEILARATITAGSN